MGDMGDMGDMGGLSYLNSQKLLIKSEPNFLFVPKIIRKIAP